MEKLNMTIGRFQPFTVGHLNMVNEGDAPCIIYRINSSDKKIERKKKGIKIGSKSYTDETVAKVISFIDNPEGELAEQAKELLKRPFTNELIEKEFELVKKANKNIVDVIPVVNMFDAIDRFNAFCTEHKDEYEPQYLMCGDDRVDEYSNLIDKYDELETELKSGKILPNILKGKLKTNTGKGRTEGVSGTAVRKAILNKDKGAFEKIMPKGTSSMLNDFIKAFDNFKENLKNIIKEHKMLSLKEFITESMSDTKLKAIGRLIKRIQDKEVKDHKELDKLMKSINCKRMTNDSEPDENGNFNAGYNNGKYSFRVFIKNNKITNYTEL